MKTSAEIMAEIAPLEKRLKRRLAKEIRAALDPYIKKVKDRSAYFSEPIEGPSGGTVCFFDNHETVANSPLVSIEFQVEIGDDEFCFVYDARTDTCRPPEDLLAAARFMKKWADELAVAKAKKA